MLGAIAIKNDSIPLKDIVIQHFSRLKKLLEETNFSVDAVVFANNEFLTSSPDFLKFKKLNGEEFLQSLNLHKDLLDSNEKIVWFDNSLLASAENYDAFIYLEFHKPIPDSLRTTISLYINESRMAMENAKLRKEAEDTSMEIIFLLSELVENKSAETGDHIKRVMKYTEILSNALGIEKALSNVYKFASMLHDIGKIGIPDSILSKPGRLTPQEFEIMKTHTTIGYNILKNSEKPILKEGSIIARYHHENFDGSGYPTGIKASEIPIEARVVSLADYYDALSSDRVYRKAWREKDILDSIKELKGKKFDPKIVDEFFDNYDKIIGARMDILHRNHPQFIKRSTLGHKKFNL
jgi:HD-GYP domain-containing protein (c-di-GMP phosphodiesterase class II)